MQLMGLKRGFSWRAAEQEETAVSKDTGHRQRLTSVRGPVQNAQLPQCLKTQLGSISA